MNRLHRFLLLLALVVAPSISRASALPAESGWAFHRGEVARTESGWDFAAAGWKAVAPFTEPEGVARDEAYWLRIPLPAGDWLQPTLFFAGFEGDSEVWTTSGLRPPSGPRLSSVVASLATGFALVPLARGDTEVFVHVAPRHADRMQGPRLRVAVGEPSDHVAWQVREDLSLLAVAAILLVFGLGALVVFLVFRKLRVLAAVGAFAVVNAALLAGVVETTFLVAGGRAAVMRWSLSAVGLFVALLCVAIAETNERLGSTGFRRLGRVLVGVGLAYAPIVVADLESGVRLMPVIVLLAMVGLVTAGIVTARAAREGDPDARALSVGALVFLVTLAVDGVPFLLTGATPLRFSIHLGLAAMTLSFAVIAGRKLVTLLDTLESQADALRSREADARASTSRLEEGARSLVDVVESLRKSSEAQTGGLTRQAAALQETQVTAEEIKRTSAMAAEKARSLLTATVEAEEVGRTAETSIDEALAGIEAIGQEVDAVARQVASVEKRASEIGGIVATVKELADQSNMLALNAAIVAVRAGEHGRGFSVVAREVRRLADQSVLATERIGKVLDGVAGGVREAAGTSQRGATRVATSVEQLRVSTQRLQRLGALSREANAGVRQISAAVTQQNAGVSQIFQAIDDLSKHMNETLERLRDTESSANRVHAVASQMSTASVGVTHPGVLQ